MLQAMRQNMKVILWITVLFFVLLIFLVWGADLQLGNAPQPNVAGLVNGEPVSASTYQQVLASNRQNARAQGRELKPSDEMLLEEQTWDTLVNDILIRQEARRLGFEARDAEIVAVVRNDPPVFITRDPTFQNAQGQFDLARYQAVLRDPQTPEQFLFQLEAYVRETLPAQKLQNALVASAKITDEELRQEYRERNETAKISYVLVTGSIASAPSSVTDQEVEDFFAANSADYQLPPRVDIHYVTIPRVPTFADSQSIRGDIEEFAAEARRAEDARREETDNRNDSEFETLAMTFSDLPDADTGGLTPGGRNENDLSEKYRSALVALAETGDVSEPFEEGGYYHILQLVERTEEEGETLYQYRDMGMRIDPSDSTIFAIREQLDAVRAEADLSDLRSAAESHGLTVQVAADVPEGGLAPGLISLPQIATFAHENKPGTLSRVMSTNTGWYLVEVGEVKPGGAPDLASIRFRVENDLLAERRLQDARAQAERLEQRVRAGDSLEQAAEAESLTVVNTPEFTRTAGVIGLGRDSAVLANAFSLEPGTTSSLVKTDRGWLLMRVDERAEISWDGFEVQRQILFQSLLSSKQSALFNSLLDELRKKASIVDYRT